MSPASVLGSLVSGWSHPPMSNSDPRQRQHLFGPTYQAQEWGDGTLVEGAAYAPDPRAVHRMMRIALNDLSSEFPKGIVFADLACNAGYHGIKLLRDGAKQGVFMDANPKNIEVTTEIAESWGVRSQGAMVSGDIQEFVYEKAFDLVMAHQVVYHLADPIDFLLRVRAALKDDGAFAMYTRMAHAVHPKTFEWVPSWVAMEEALQHVGFRSVSIIGEKSDLVRVHPKTRDIHSRGQEKVLVVARAF